MLSPKFNSTSVRPINMVPMLGGLSGLVAYSSYKKTEDSARQGKVGSSLLYGTLAFGAGAATLQAATQKGMAYQHMVRASAAMSKGLTKTPVLKPMVGIMQSKGFGLSALGRIAKGLR